MWLWLLAPCLLITSSSGLAAEPQTGARAAPVSPSSQGPTSAEEAEILWNDGKQAFEKGDYETAVRELQRLVDRYPGKKGYLEAHLILGKSRIELKEGAKAIRPLRYYIEASGKSINGLNGRLELGRAYLQIRKFSEALLTAMEAEKLASSKPEASNNPDLESKMPQVLLLKSRALIGLNRDLRASEALDAAAKRASDPRFDPAVRGAIAETDEELKLRACARFPGKGPIGEDQLRSQLVARGECLGEATLLFKKALETGHEPAARKSAEDLSDALIHYFQACENPVNPPGKRTAEQLREYRAELRTLLVRECTRKIENVYQLIGDWKLPNGMKPHVTYVAKTIERLK